LTLLTLSASLRRLKPSACPAAAAAAQSESCPGPSSLQVGFFFFALYLISLGTGGIKPCLEAFGADQFDDDNDPRERDRKSSFFNWWYFGVGIGGLVAVTVLVYVEANWSWELGFGIPAAVMAAGCALFFAGTTLYRRQPPGGSPLTQIAQVIP
jgi:peptide/histidine transporter 3/4